MPRIQQLAFILAAALFSLPAAALDPLCANMHGFERFNPLARNPLAVITKCIPVYCDPNPPSAQVVQNLKDIDNALVELTVTTSQTKLSLQKFIRACKAINGDMTQTGPKMQVFKDSVMELSLNKGKLSDEYFAMQKNPLEKVIEDTGTAIARAPYNVLACQDQMNNSVIDELNAAQKVMPAADIECTPNTK
jgi:hypothetical protein